MILQLPRFSQLSVAIVAIVAIALSGCTWVKVSESGAHVAVRTAAEVANCQKVGGVSGKTVAKVVVTRNARKVQEEVTALGKNEAGKIGGDTIVPSGPINAGEQEFDVYKCGR